MKPTDMVVEFLNFVFLVLLIIFCIFFFILWDQFDRFKEIILSLAPLSFFGLIFVIKTKMTRKVKKRRAREEGLDITLQLRYEDKLKSDIVTFSLPIIILIIPLITQRYVSITDILQASLAFIMVYLLQKSLFDKEEL